MAIQSNLEAEMEEKKVNAKISSTNDTFLSSIPKRYILLPNTKRETKEEEASLKIFLPSVISQWK